MSRTFRALMVRESEGVYNKAVEEVSFSEMVENEVLIEVKYSSVNYKDALSASGNKGGNEKIPSYTGN